jgi:hypothetical protein
MIPLGMKQHIIGAEQWSSLRIHGRPQKMPKIPRGHTVVCGLKRCSTERMIVCESLEQMQTLYDKHAGEATIVWYHIGVFVVPLRSVT